MSAEQPVLAIDRLGAVMFDTEGVLVDTTRERAAAWKRSVDEFLRHRQRSMGVVLDPFDLPADYLHYLGDGSRLAGVRAFLSSRGILDSDRNHAIRPGEQHRDELAAALADRQSHYFREEIARYGVAAYPATVALVHDLRGRGAHTVAVSPSRSGCRVLAAAQVQRLFDVRMDGADAAELGLPRKPHPALLLEATHRLGMSPTTVAVLVHGPDGVEAARRGRFGMIVGVDRGDSRGFALRAAELRDRGAHAVVRDLAELVVTGRRRGQQTY